MKTILKSKDIEIGQKEYEDGKTVVIDLSKNVDIDYDVAEAIKDFKTSAVDRGIKLTIIHEEKLGGGESLGH